MKDSLEYYLLRSINAISRLLPFSFIARLGGWAGLFVYYVIPVRKKVALKNIHIAFPEKSDEERKLICKKCYRNFGTTFFEYLKIYQLSREQLIHNVIYINPEIILELFSKGKGLIGVTGHFGSFELMGLAVARITGIPMDFVVKEMHNKKAESFLESLRSKANIGVIKLGEKFSTLIKSLSEGRLLVLASDQDAGSTGTFVKFFGIDSSVASGTALLALRSKAPVLVGCMIREGSAKYRVELHKMETEDISGSPKEKIQELTQRYTSILEEYVRQYPEQYFWMHKKWKSSNIY